MAPMRSFGAGLLLFAPGIGLLLIYQTTARIHLSMGTNMRWLRWTVVELTLTGALFGLV